MALSGRMRAVRALLAAGLALCWLSGTVPAAAGAEECLDVSQVPATASAERTWPQELEAWLTPTHECPYCGRRFSEHRSLIMLLIGFIGQLVFTSRFLVQWIASERKKQSYIPIMFWYLSILGSLLLLAYAISIWAWPIILGQAFGVLVYGRNLALIARAKTRQAGESPPEGPSSQDASTGADDQAR